MNARAVRRDFLKASGAGLGAALAASAVPAGAELPIPPAAADRIATRPAAGRGSTRCWATSRTGVGRSPRRSAGEEEKDGYVLESWVLDLNGLEPVPAYLARPKGPGRPAPAVVFDHSHGGGYDIGKKEFVDGRSYMQPVPVREGAHRRGLRRACASTTGASASGATRRELDTFKAMLWQGQVLWGMMVYDSIRALDWLLTRGDVDGVAHRDAGHVDGQLDGAVAGRPRRAGEGDRGHLLPHRVPHAARRRRACPATASTTTCPGLLKEFTASDINALIAPRAHLGLAGTQDKLTPLAGLDIIDRELKAAYAEAGHPDRWKLLRYDVGHQETAEGRREVLAFLRAHL